MFSPWGEYLFNKINKIVVFIQMFQSPGFRQFLFYQTCCMIVQHDVSFLCCIH